MRAKITVNEILLPIALISAAGAAYFFFKKVPSLTCPQGSQGNCNKTGPYYGKINGKVHTTCYCPLNHPGNWIILPKYKGIANVMLPVSVLPSEGFIKLGDVWLPKQEYQRLLAMYEQRADALKSLRLEAWINVAQVTLDSYTEYQSKSTLELV